MSPDLVDKTIDQSDAAHLRALAEKLMSVPFIHGIDQYDAYRLRRTAAQIDLLTDELQRLRERISSLPYAQRL